MGVPTVFEFVKNEDDRKVVELIISQTVFHRSYIAPPDTPPAQLEVLRAAFDKTVADPQFLADAEKLGIDIEPLSGAKVQDVVAKLYATPPGDRRARAQGDPAGLSTPSLRTAPPCQPHAEEPAAAGVSQHGCTPALRDGASAPPQDVP